MRAGHRADETSRLDRQEHDDHQPLQRTSAVRMDHRAQSAGHVPGGGMQLVRKDPAQARGGRPGQDANDRQGGGRSGSQLAQRQQGQGGRVDVRREGVRDHAKPLALLGADRRDRIGEREQELDPGHSGAEGARRRPAEDEGQQGRCADHRRRPARSRGDREVASAGPAILIDVVEVVERIAEVAHGADGEHHQGQERRLARAERLAVHQQQHQSDRQRRLVEPPGPGAREITGDQQLTSVWPAAGGYAPSRPAAINALSPPWSPFP